MIYSKLHRADVQILKPCHDILIKHGTPREEEGGELSMTKSITKSCCHYTFRLFNLKDHREIGALMQHEGKYLL